MNALGNEIVKRRRPMIVAHGGVAVGSIPSNTSLSVKAARASGADVIKIDVAASTDNIFYAFHDGYEPELLGVDRNIQSMTAAEISDLSYIWHDRPLRPARVERLLSLMVEFKGTDTIFALDRSWWRWPTLLKLLDGRDMGSQVLLKVPAWETSALNKLRQHKVKYPVLAICSTLEEYIELSLDDSINILGIELLATYDDEVWFEPGVIDGIHDDGRLVWVNSETLTTGVPLFGGYDDERAVAESPDAAWSRLLDLGVDAIQTDFPWLLREFRDARTAS